MGRKLVNLSSRSKLYEFGQHPHDISFWDFIVVYSEKGVCLFLGSKTTHRFYKKIENAIVKAIHDKIKVPPVDREIVIRTVRVFVSAQTEIDFVIMEDFLKSNLDSIKCSISMECILSQTSTFMITIATIHWSVAHCDNPWSNCTILVCLFQICFDEFDFSGITRGSGDWKGSTCSWKGQLERTRSWKVLFLSNSPFQLHVSRLKCRLIRSLNPWLDLEDVVYPTVGRHHNSRIR